MALIKGKQLVAGTIDTRELKDSAVTNAKINAGEITPDRLNISGQTFDFSGAASLSAPAPTAAGHVATKGYADSVAQGLDVKESVRVATTAPLISGTSPRFEFISTGVGVLNEKPFVRDATLSIDGISLALGDRVLVKDQLIPSQNGVYEITREGDGSSIGWQLTRAADADSSDKLNNGAFVFIGQGSTYQGAGYVLTTPDPITLNTTDLAFTQFSGAGQLTGGDGVQISGNTISLDLAAAGGLEIVSAELALKVEDNSLALSSNGVKVQHHNTSTATGANGILAAVPVSNRLNLTPLAVSVDGGSTGISMLIAQAAGSRVDVFVNGVMAALGDGVKTLDCYFSGDSGATARAQNAIQAGDVLYWNGASVYALETDDRVSILYNAVL
jgi:hypothetical protein